MTATPNTTAREYLRVSYDRTGKERSPEEQHEDNLDLAELLNFEIVGKPYRDLGSASVHRRRERDDFDQLRADIKAGRFGADLLVVWEVSRLSREVDDWPGMLKDCIAAGVCIAVYMDGRIYDPTNSADKRTLYNAAVDAEYESAKVSLRTKRAMRRAAANGAAHGRIPFGYRRVLDADGQTAQKPEPAEAAIVVELFTRINKGEPMAAIAKAFAERGITSRSGIPFGAQTLRGMALAPVYSGRRVHLPGKAGRAQRGTEAKTTKGCWDALVPDELFFAVRRRLSDPARRTVRPGRGIHLLSMLARCDVCGAKLAATDRKGDRAYQCHGKGCVKIKAGPLDDWATRQIIDALTNPEALDQPQPSDDHDELLSAARGAVEEARFEHAALLTAAERGEAGSPAMVDAQERGIANRLAAAEATVAELTAPAELDGLITAGPDVAAQWEAATMATKREIVRLMFSPQRFGALTVARAAVTGVAGPVSPRIRLGGKPLPLR